MLHKPLLEASRAREVSRTGFRGHQCWVVLAGAWLRCAGTSKRNIQGHMRRGPETRLAPCKSRPGACQQAAMTGQSHPPCPTNVLPGRPSWIPQLLQGGHLRTHTGCHLLLYRADSPDEHSSAATRRQGRENLRAEGKRRKPAEEPRPGESCEWPRSADSPRAAGVGHAVVQPFWTLVCSSGKRG